MRSAVLSALSLLFIALRLSAMPAEIVILRHAEKAAEGPELSERGWERARALPSLFRKRASSPAMLIGMAPRKAGHSVRAIQSLQYLAKDFGIPIVTDYSGDEVETLVNDVESEPSVDGRTVVICWHRNNLPELISAFGGPNIGKVGKELYDRLWILQFNGKSQPRFANLPQRLLPGDSAD